MRRNSLALAALTIVLAPLSVPAAEDLIQGSPILTVLPVDAIPAIDNPT